MSLAFDVDTPVTDGVPLPVLDALYGKPAFVSNGAAAFAPDMLKTTTAAAFAVERVPLNVTVTEVTAEVATTA